MEEVQNQNFVEQPKSYKKFVIIGVVLLISILIIGYFIFKIYNEKKEVERSNKEVLRFIKCAQDCPNNIEYEINIFKNNSDNLWFPNRECLSSCGNKYHYDPEPLSLSTKYKDDLIYTEVMGECWNPQGQNKSLFDHCVDKMLKKYSYIIDLSDVDVNTNYHIHNATIKSAVCGSDKTIVTIILTAGSDIEEIIFSLNRGDNEGNELIHIKDIPIIGELKTYDLIYQEEDTLKFKPTSVEINIKTIDGEYIPTLDKKEC